MASVIYAGRGARNHRGVHSIRLIHDYRNWDGNSWGSQSADPSHWPPPTAVSDLVGLRVDLEAEGPVAEGDEIRKRGPLRRAESSIAIELAQISPSTPAGADEIFDTGNIPHTVPGRGHDAGHHPGHICHGRGAVPRTRRRLVRRPEPAEQSMAPSERWTYLAAAGSPLVVFVLANAMFWGIDIRRDHGSRVSG